MCLLRPGPTIASWFRGARRPDVVVAAAAVAAALLRLPALAAPIGADEAGFTQVARAWDADPDTLYGRYWVARPPTMIALVRLSDLVGGPLFLRVVGAAGCLLLVLAAAATARHAVRHAGVADEGRVRRSGAWAAVLAAALTSSALIDPASTKGELLGIPFVLTSFWLVLAALDRDRTGRAAWLLAGLSGVASALAVGMKQNMAAGIVFGLTLLVASRVVGRISTPGLARMLGAGVAGALVPPAAVAGWALVSGVGLGPVWYALVGFRSDTLEVLATDTTGGSPARGLVLVGIGLATGLLLVVAGVVAHRRQVWRRDPVVLLAVTAALAVDLVGLVLGGQYWRPYLYVLVPDVVVCGALLMACGAPVAGRLRSVVAVAAACSVVSSLVWTSMLWRDALPADEESSGRAIAEVARPHDSIVSYGGAADLVLSSGLQSPYPYLWSLQMRTRDPDLSGLRSLLRGPRAPTWVVMLAPGGSWKRLDEAIRPALERRYDVQGQVCNGRYVWLRAGVDRARLTPECGPA